MPGAPVVVRHEDRRPGAEYTGVGAVPIPGRPDDGGNRGVSGVRHRSPRPAAHPDATVEGAKGSGEYGAVPAAWCDGQTEDGMIGAQEGADALPAPVFAAARYADVDGAIVTAGDDHVAHWHRREGKDGMAVENAFGVLPRRPVVGGPPDPLRRPSPEQVRLARIVQQDVGWEGEAGARPRAPPPHGPPRAVEP